MVVVGITGSLSSGKATAAAIFHREFHYELHELQFGLDRQKQTLLSPQTHASISPSALPSSVFRRSLLPLCDNRTEIESSFSHHDVSSSLTGPSSSCQAERALPVHPSSFNGVFNGTKECHSAHPAISPTERDGKSSSEITQWLLRQMEEEASRVAKEVSQRWRDNHVVFPITHQCQLDALSRRPYFLLVAIEAPSMIRFSRYVRKGLLRTTSAGQPAQTSTTDSPSRSNSFPSSHNDHCRKHADEGPVHLLLRERFENSRKEFLLGNFLAADDALTFGTAPGQDETVTGSRRLSAGYLQLKCNNKESLSTVVNDSTFKDLEALLRVVDANCKRWTVWPWEDYFMRLAHFVSRRTNCLKRRVGALIVKNNRIISTGYNGTASGSVNCYDGGCDRCANPERFGQAVGLDQCECIHAEVNAVLEAGGREKCLDSSLYVTLMPCMGCAKQIAQGGVKRVLYADQYDPDGKAMRVFEKSGVTVKKYEGGPNQSFLSRASLAAITARDETSGHYRPQLERVRET